MLSHISDLKKGLLWTRSGLVWAIWRIKPMPYLYQPDEKKEGVRALHTALYRSLPGESLHLGLIASTAPGEVVEAMIAGIDLDSRPAWVAECSATLDFLQYIELGRRAHWIAVPLPNAGRHQLLEPVRTASAWVKDMAALPRASRSQRDQDQRFAQAEGLRKELPRTFEPEPASVAEIAWIVTHMMHRGLDLDGPLPVAGSVSEELHLAGGAVLPSMVIDPAGQTDVDKTLDPVSILRRPFVKLIDPSDPSRCSYQSTLVVADTPPGGLSFPEGEWLGRLDACGQQVDWAMRMTVRGRGEVLRRNRKAVRTLNDQFDQREEEIRAGSPLVAIEESLLEYQRIIDSDELELEVDATTLFTVAAPSADAVVDSARELKKHFEAMRFKVALDPTIQDDLFEAALPGIPTKRAIREYSQITPTSGGFAAAVPYITTRLGDRRGQLLGLEDNGGLPNPILLNVRDTSAKDIALAIAFCGELGAGKSVSMKTVCGDAIDRGGATLLAVDATDMGEWEIAVSRVAGSQVGDISENAKYSIDPLRVLPMTIATRVARSFLTVLLGLPTQSRETVLLSKVLSAQYAREHAITSLGALVRHLSDDCALDGAKDLADHIRVFSELDFGRALFDEDLPAIDLMDAPAIVLRTHRLRMPSKADMEHGHLFSQMPAEKIFGRATFALIAALARHRCFTHRDRLDIFAADEVNRFMSSPEGAEELATFVRDGRKHLACAVLGGHDPEDDFGNEVIRGLIAFRVLMRHRDKNLATRGVRWLQGLPANKPVDESMVKEVSEDLSPVIEDEVPEERRGECFIRDFNGNIGRVKIMAPLVEARAETVKTTPTTSAGRYAA